jgi:kojibiose phosphorylase
MSDFLLSTHPDPSWLLIEEGIEPAREHEIESTLAIANGYLGTRASVAEGGRFSHPSTFVAGVYVPGTGLGGHIANACCFTCSAPIG